MSYSIEVTPNFKKEAKKYPSFKEDLKIFFQYLSKNPTSGTPLGKQIYKNRLAIRSEGKGKSGGARVITYVKISASLILLLSIYDKSEKTTISDSELKELINKYLD